MSYDCVDADGGSDDADADADGVHGWAGVGSFAGGGVGRFDRGT